MLFAKVVEALGGSDIEVDGTAGLTGDLTHRADRDLTRGRVDGDCGVGGSREHLTQRPLAIFAKGVDGDGSRALHDQGLAVIRKQRFTSEVAASGCDLMVGLADRVLRGCGTDLKRHRQDSDESEYRVRSQSHRRSSNMSSRVLGHAVPRGDLG
ncbi:MAG: hypothetical protein CVU56_05105 [Deltaproteobacteria bacterium HGW-Deltaproteobacteria-14]|nr:MAG: hypothetical protein CVU56_05105 [Deltaproteobacteria bacterium HGW-Deltaproteobacteria-14]